MIGTAYAQAGAPASQGDTLMGLLPIVLMFVILYFLMIRPQMKKAKEHKAMIDALAKGDEVAVAGGLLGRIDDIGESVISVELAPGLTVKVQKHAIAAVLPKGTLKSA